MGDPGGKAQTGTQTYVAAAMKAAAAAKAAAEVTATAVTNSNAAATAAEAENAAAAAEQAAETAMIEATKAVDSADAAERGRSQSLRKPLRLPMTPTIWRLLPESCSACTTSRRHEEGTGEIEK